MFPYVWTTMLYNGMQVTHFTFNKELHILRFGNCSLSYSKFDTISIVHLLPVFYIHLYVYIILYLFITLYFLKEQVRFPSCHYSLTESMMTPLGSVVLSHQKPKIQNSFINNDIKQREAANPHIWQGGTSRWLTLCSINDLNNYIFNPLLGLCKTKLQFRHFEQWSVQVNITSNLYEVRLSGETFL